MRGKVTEHKMPKLLFILFFIFAQATSAWAARLTVPDNLIGRRTLYLRPAALAPASPQEGQLYYNSIDNKIYYCESVSPLSWKELSLGLATDKTVATKIVAASNSLGTVAGPPYTNPRADYTCDGTADQVEIQAAIDALPTGGGAVYLLEGTYNLSGPITLDNLAPDDSAKSLIGAGRATVLRAAGSINLINAISVSGILISQLSLDGNSAGRYSIFLNTVTNSKIDNLWIFGMSHNGIGLSSSSNNSILNSYIQANTMYGIELFSSANNNIISNSYLRSNALVGVKLESSQNNTISANHIFANGLGIRLWLSSNNSLLANNLQDNGPGVLTKAGGISVEQSSNNIISGNNLQANADYGMLIATPSSFSNNINANNLNLNTEHGIVVSSSSSNLISGNLFSDNGGSGAFDGIRLGGDADSNLISSNLVNDNSGLGYGIFLGALTCGNNYLSANLIGGGGYSPDRRILDLGGNTRYTDKQKLTIERQTIPYSGVLVVDNPPRGYVVFSPGPGPSLTLSSISDGQASGDLLILEGPSTGSVTIMDETNVQLGDSSRILSAQDTLKLLWNGTDWIELSYSDN